MKKLYVAAASLLLASTAAMAISEELPTVKTGALTIGLTAAYTEGGFAGGEYETVLSESPYRSQYKSVAKTAKFTNTEFIQSLINGEYLWGSASDWSLVVAHSDEFDYYGDGVAFFAIGNSNVENDVVYLGGDGYYYGPYSEFPLSVTSGGEGIYGESVSESSVYTSTDSDYSYKGRARGKESSLIYMTIPVPYNYEYYDYDLEEYYIEPGYRPLVVVALGVNNFNESYSYSYNYDTEAEVDIYTPAASSITNIVGASTGYGYASEEEGYDSPLFGAIFTGSFKAAALTDVTDQDLVYTLLDEYYYSVDY